MRKKRVPRSVTVVAWALLASSVMAQAGGGKRASAPAPASRPAVSKAGKTDAKDLAAQLANRGTPEQTAALAKVRSIIKTEAASGFRQFQNHFLPAMLKGGLNEETAEMAMVMILTHPENPQTLWELQDARTRALLAMGKAKEALASGKSAFNIAPMEYTADAIQRLAECLAAANPDDPQVAKRFMQEQTMGAELLPTTQPAQSDIRTSPMLKAIKVDATIYDEAIRQGGQKQYVKYVALAGQGNLLLLADRPAEARPLFENAYSLATDKDLPAATENLARVMKAEDGTIGRANSWLLSLRPEE